MGQPLRRYVIVQRRSLWRKSVITEKAILLPTYERSKRYGSYILQVWASDRHHAIQIWRQWVNKALIAAPDCQDPNSLAVVLHYNYSRGGIVANLDPSKTVATKAMLAYLRHNATPYDSGLIAPFAFPFLRGLFCARMRRPVCDFLSGRITTFPELIHVIHELHLFVPAWAYKRSPISQEVAATLLG
ncbi:hypothetical protein JI721_12130 [Alicyclobacillus cycloheptanicus]|uniref:Uncharacterized protein n=1 Tax=Alicyclobacillus cycloheptanicus TaxID=1457 RepID=A0ABT9XLS3_9BACL|nr:hypothetical protein [Alicyclobacillus cycloheptanicus]MDQ0191258.1 hypothetical protein [Alicyclobacillus cycloheptanicus]WDM00464.1 hypothetical protein JI721_12130 [Alicyclobacillus cycloheptanicus]